VQNMVTDSVFRFFQARPLVFSLSPSIFIWRIEIIDGKSRLSN